MSFLLAFLYWVGGIILAIPISIGIGFIMCALIGIFNLFQYKWTWAFVLVYSLGAGLMYLFVIALFLIFGYVGDRTDYENQTMILVGLILPGIFMLKIFPLFVKIALKQTKGKNVT